jgi:hypothetical protein
LDALEDRGSDGRASPHREQGFQSGPEKPLQLKRWYWDLPGGDGRSSAFSPEIRALTALAVKYIEANADSKNPFPN